MVIKKKRRNIKYPFGLGGEHAMVEVHAAESDLWPKAGERGLSDDRTPLAVYRLRIHQVLSNEDDSDYMTYVGTDEVSGLKVSITLPLSMDSNTLPPDWENRFTIRESK